MKGPEDMLDFENPFKDEKERIFFYQPSLVEKESGKTIFTPTQEDGEVLSFPSYPSLEYIHNLYTAHCEENGEETAPLDEISMNSLTVEVSPDDISQSEAA